MFISIVLSLQREVDKDFKRGICASVTFILTNSVYDANKNDVTISKQLTEQITIARVHIRGRLI